MKSFKEILKQLRCKHDYRFCRSFLIDSGMRKAIIYECGKCGKRKVKFV